MNKISHNPQVMSLRGDPERSRRIAEVPLYGTPYSGAILFFFRLKRLLRRFRLKDGGQVAPRNDYKLILQKSQ